MDCSDRSYHQLAQICIDKLDKKIAVLDNIREAYGLEKNEQQETFEFIRSTLVLSQNEFINGYSEGYSDASYDQA